MAAGDVKKVYSASSALTVTNLHSLAASQTHITGWESAVQVNTSTLVLDAKVGLHLVTHASNRQAGAIRVYLGTPLNDTPTYGDVFDGTESAETFTDTEERDAYLILAKEVEVDNSASAVYDIIIPSVKAVFAGNMPERWFIVVTGNATTTTTAQFASSGSTVHVTNSYLNVAAA